MQHSSILKGYAAYLTLEKGLSAHSVEAYRRDVEKLMQYAEIRGWQFPWREYQLNHLEDFVKYLGELDAAPNSQARVISGIKGFFKYLVTEEITLHDPSELLEAPKQSRKLPTVLTVDEVQSMLEIIDHSTPEGMRNRAILETLYACGLRVSELIGLKTTDLYREIGFVRVRGKGNKERLVPVGSEALKYIALYENHTRPLVKTKPGHEASLFLSRRGEALSREMVFRIVQDTAALANIEKTVSPHTFRHTFATHLIEGGADLKAIQDMLGHESITTTEIYTHLDTEFLRETIASFHPRSRR